MKHDRKYQAVIFDLDGVIVTTDQYHYQAWKQIADSEGIPFDYSVNDRLRGVSRMESLNILLEASGRTYSREEKKRLAEAKNDYYVRLLTHLRPKDILPGVPELLDELKKLGVRTAVGSSSKNAVYILERIGLGEAFDVIIDGNQITHTKPDPEVFLLAAERLGVSPSKCIVVEDAMAGIEAASGAGIRTLAVGNAVKGLEIADNWISSLDRVDLDKLLSA